MSLINYNRDNIKSEVLQNVSEALDIESLSESSKVRLISDALGEEISNASEVINNGYDNIYLETAEGLYLEKAAADVGVYRIKQYYLNVSSVDNIVTIAPKDGNEVFGDVTNAATLINAGEVFILSTLVKVTVTQNVLNYTGNNSIAISCQIHVEQNGSFQINAGQEFELISEDDPTSQLFTSLKIHFNTPLNVSNEEEDDNNLRIRAISKRDGQSHNIPKALSTVLSLIYSIKDSIIFLNKRGSGTLDIGITTQELYTAGFDDQIDTYRNHIQQQVAEVAVVGTDIVVFVPDQASLFISYTTDLSEELDPNIKKAIVAAFLDQYTYGSPNTLSSTDMEDSIKDSLGTESFTITDMMALEQVMNDPISQSRTLLELPSSYYLFLSELSIERGDVINGTISV